jgi:DNA end-binding protein Ku
VARAYWSGQLQISLVSFGINLFPATESKSEIRFHQISRRSGERVRHQKVSASDEEPVQKDDIVMGYEYSKGEYVRIEPGEIAQLRVASRHTLEIQQFVALEEIDPAFFEKPYFISPENETQADAFSVVQKALRLTRKAGLGKIATGGREHIIAIVSPADVKLAGMMAYTLRYAAELRNPAEYFAGVKTATVDNEQLSLAKELIQRKTAKFAPEKFNDEYEIALRRLVDAKVKHVPLPRDQKAAPRGKVVDLMDALRRSVSQNSAKKPPARISRESAKGRRANHGLTLLKPGSDATGKRRKSA